MKFFIKSTLFLMFSLIAFQTNYAQNSGIREIDAEKDKGLDRSKDVFRFGYTPSALINNYLGLQVNGAVNLNENIQFNLETGWIFSNSSFNDLDASGYRIRPAIRWYVTDGYDSRVHLSLGYNIRNTTEEKIHSFTLANGSSVTNLKYDQDRKLAGLAVLIGVDLWLGDRTILDIGFGFGRGKLTIIDKGTPANSIKNGTFLSNEEPGESTYPIIILNIRFQYAI